MVRRSIFVSGGTPRLPYSIGIGRVFSFLATFTVLKRTKAFCFPPYDFVPLRETRGIEEVHMVWGICKFYM